MLWLPGDPEPPCTFTSTHEFVTPLKQQEWLNAKLNGQRILRKAQVKHLRKAMRRDEFRHGEIVLFIDPKTGQTWLVNGQHRLTAMFQENMAFWMTVTRNYGDEAAARSYYAGLDLSGIRTVKERVRIIGLDESLGLGAEETLSLYSACGRIASGFDQKYLREVDWDNCLALCYEWAEYAKPVFDLYRPFDYHLTRPLRTCVPLALAMITMRSQPEMAKQFWTALATQQWATYSPERALFVFMAETVRHDKRDFNHWARAIAKAWNARLRGDVMKYALKVSQIELSEPLRLIGCPPYDGTRPILPCADAS